MIIGIGCDIVEIKRINKSIERFGEKFLKRIFTDNEVNIAPSHADLYINYFAKRFAAKEAFAKALGTGIGRISFKDIEITNDNYGKPVLKFLNSGFVNYKNIHLSLSDEKDYALAFVIIED